MEGGRQTRQFVIAKSSLETYFLQGTLKRRSALGFDLTALTHFCFSVALYMKTFAL